MSKPRRVSPEWFFVVTCITDRGDVRYVTDTVDDDEAGFAIETARDLHWAVWKMAEKVLYRENYEKVTIKNITSYFVQRNDLSEK